WLEMGLVAQIQDLEKRLRGSLLVQFCKAVGWKVPATIQIQIMDQKSYERNRDDKGMYYLCFDIVFQINMLLPPRMALGKNVAFGFGVIEHY
ncbi:MAG: CRISPR-associated endonuclease Cas6, partial [Saprospiraceae bacterium]